MEEQLGYRSEKIELEKVTGGGGDGSGNGPGKQKNTNKRKDDQLDHRAIRLFVFAVV
jgi:hypothetical protein